MAARRSFASAAAMMCAALALWVSFGATTFADTGSRGTRVGLLPPLVWLAGLLAAALVAAIIWKPSAQRVAPLWLSTILLLPWLPLHMPASAFLWTGALRWWVWTAIVVAIVAPAIGGWLWKAHRDLIVVPRRAALAAGAIAAIAYAAGAWAVAPRLPAGDEPHYLIITQSLLGDGDLRIENNHQRGDYRAYFGGVLPPHYLRRGTNLEIYSIHAPGLPLLIAPAFALFGFAGVKAALLLASAAATALAWLVAWRVTRDPAASWFAWAAVAFSAPLFFHTFAVYPDAPGAALMLIGVLPLVDERWRQPRRLLLVGAALAALPWLHTRFALGAAALAIVIVGRLVGANAVRARLLALFGCPIVSAAAWFAFFQIIYGTANPTAPYGGATQSAIDNLPRGVPGLLFDEQFGLLPNAPVYACALCGFFVMPRRGDRRLALELLLICVPYAFTVAEFQMWWAGYSAPARFLVPTTLVLAIPAASWFAGARRTATRLLGVGALFLTVMITFTLAAVDRGAVLFNFRDGAWQLGLWLSPAVNLTTALPSLFQGSPSAAMMNAGIWLAAVAVTLVFGLGLERLGMKASTLAVTMGLMAAGGSMAAASMVWRRNLARPVTPSGGGIALLKDYDPGGRQIGLSFRPFRRLRAADVPKTLTLASVEPSAVHPGEALIFLNHLPAGIYAIDTTIATPASGTVRVATDRLTPPLEEWPAALLGSLSRRLVTFPVGLEALRVDADDAARASIRRMTLRPLEIPPVRDRPSRDLEATSGSRYGPAAVYVVRGRAYLEPGGLWVGGSQTAQLVVAADRGQPIRLFLRNTAAGNRVSLASGSWKQELTLRPREERGIEIPSGGNRLGAVLDVTVVNGARPVDFEPGSKDERFLGCWLETR